MTERNLTLGSLFDGSAGFPLGGLISGITPVFASEVEPFPIRVTTKRLPQMQHLGDVSALNGADLPPVDIITSEVHARICRWQASEQGLTAPVPAFSMKQ